MSDAPASKAPLVALALVFSALAVLAVVLSTRAAAPVASTVNAEPVDVSIEDLILRPRDFDGRVVRTSGFPRFSWDHCCSVFASSSARKAFKTERSLALQFLPLSLDAEPLLASHAGPIASLRPFATGAASITAVFTIGDPGEGVRVGSLVKVSAFLPSTSGGVEDLSATFDQWMARKLAPSP